MNSARYDLTMNPKTIKLMPPEETLPILKRDYESMHAMLFGGVPSFDEIMAAIIALESEINELS